MTQWLPVRLNSALLGMFGAVLGLVCISPATADEWAFMGARYQGMGGAGVASVNDSFASYWNPAALGYTESYEVALNADIMISAEGDIVSTIDDLDDLIGSSEFEDLFDELEALAPGDMLSDEAQDTLAELEAQLAELGATDDGIVGNTTAGLNMRWKNYALFSRMLAEFAISPVYDDVNVLAAPSSVPKSILNNQSGARLRGLGVIEVGVGYGHTFFDDRISVGANLKYLRGITYDEYVNYLDIDEADISFSDSDLRSESNNFGLDLGFMYKPFDWMRVGMVARNVNGPTFSVSGSTGGPNPSGSFKLEQQVRAGAAFYPFSNNVLVLATDMDVTTNDSDLIRGFDSRIWSLGGEVNVPLWSMAMSFRGGGYMNTANGSSNAFAFTAGFGLRAWVLSLDVAAGYSPKTVEVKDDDTFPSRFNLGVVLAVRGKF